MINSLFIFVVSLWLVIRGAIMATKYSAKLAKNFHLSKYIVGFIIIAIISILPETFIAVNSAISGIPSFGLGMLFGSNIADLTLIVAIIIFVSRRSIKVESKILKNKNVYPFLLLLPLILGLNGHLSRIEGTALILVGVIFYYFTIRGNPKEYPEKLERSDTKIKDTLMLLLSMSMLLIGAHFTVSSASFIATGLGVSPILIGMLIVSLGTTMPELFFAINSVKKNDDTLAVGDILGTVLADATIVVGLIAVIRPFSFPIKAVYVSGIFMVIASFLLFKFMNSGKSISRREAWLLLLFWLTFVVTEFAVNS